MNIPLFGTITVAHWEWWLYHNPFRKSFNQCQGSESCQLCGSDTGCCSGCPHAAIQEKFAEIKMLMHGWLNKNEELNKSEGPKGAGQDLCVLGVAEPCSKCNGTMMIVRRYSITTGEPVRQQCIDCRGLGVVPSELGEELLKFVHRYGRGRQ
jgi:hypothetical protein